MVDWWDTNYTRRRQVTVTNASGSESLPSGYTITFSDFDHAAEVTGGESLASGDDVRMVYWDGATNTEIDRIGADFNTSTPDITFQTQASIASSSNSGEAYWIYYNYASASSPPVDGTNIYDFFDDFNRADSATVGNGWTDSNGEISGNRFKYDVSDGPSGISRTDLGISDAIFEWEYEQNKTGVVSEIRISDGVGGNNLGIIIQTSAGNFVAYNGFNNPVDLGITIASDTTYDFRILAKAASTFDLYIDGVLEADDFGYHVAQSNLNKILFDRQSATGIYYIDDFKVSKYVTPEPTSVTGSEEGPASLTARTFILYDYRRTQVVQDD